MNNKILKKKKKVNFGNLRVFYFYRAQGFDTIPMTGSISLGMEMKHYDYKDYSFSEFYKASSRENSLKLASWRLAIKAKTNKNFSDLQSLKYLQKTRNPNKNSLKSLNFISSENCINSIDLSQCSSTTKLEDNCQNEYDNTYLRLFPEKNNKLTENELNKSYSNSFLTFENETSSKSDTDSISSFSTDEDYGSEFDEIGFYLKPIQGKLRKTILKNSGIVIDKSFRKETKEISKSRLTCGCNCLNGQCLPESCECSLLGIKCQVDKPFFPCACSNECKNPRGRIAYDYIKIRSHWFQTIVRMKVIQSKGLENSSLGVSPQRITFDEKENKKALILTNE